MGIALGTKDELPNPHRGKRVYTVEVTKYGEVVASSRTTKSGAKKMAKYWQFIMKHEGCTSGHISIGRDDLDRAVQIWRITMPPTGSYYLMEGGFTDCW